MVAGLRNVHDDLAEVRAGLGRDAMPERLEAARATDTATGPSRALSILANVPGTFAGRRLGVLIGDGFDAALVGALRWRW